MYVLASAVALASLHERIAVLAVLPYASAQCDRFFAVESRGESEGLQGEGGPGKASLAKVVVCNAKQAAEVGWTVADLSFVQLGSPFLSAAGGDPGGREMGKLHLAVLVVAQERTGHASSDEMGSSLSTCMHACICTYPSVRLLCICEFATHLVLGCKHARARTCNHTYTHTHKPTQRHKSCMHTCIHSACARIHQYALAEGMHP